MEKVFLLNYRVSYDENTKTKIFNTFETAKEFVNNYKHPKQHNAFIVDYHIRVEEVYDETLQDKLDKQYQKNYIRFSEQAQLCKTAISLIDQEKTLNRLRKGVINTDDYKASDTFMTQNNFNNVCQICKEKFKTLNYKDLICPNCQEKLNNDLRAVSETT